MVTNGRHSRTVSSVDQKTSLHFDEDLDEAQSFQALRHAGRFQKWRRGWWTIVPDGNPFIDGWDVLMIMALLATAFVLPYEVALVTDPSEFQQKFDLSVNGIFIVDIILTFNVAFTATSFKSQGKWERRPWEITKYYMAWPFSDNFRAGWFWPDALTVLPWESFLQGGSVESVRMVRVVRLLRMFRLVRVMKLYTRGHTKYGFSIALVKIVRCLAITILVLHWLACFWAHIGLNASSYTPFPEECWLTRTSLASEKPIVEFTEFETYRLAVYFFTVLLTTIGFGDILPVNMIEIVFITITVFMAGLMWAWVVANVVGIIGEMDGFSVCFNQAMDELNTLMVFRDVDRTLQKRVRRHMHEAFSVHQSRHHWQLTSWLSPALQGELAVASGIDEVCRCVWYFKRLPNGSWITDLVLQFRAELFSAKETILDRTSVSVIRRGSCLKKGRVLSKGDIFGEDMILTTEALRDTSCARALGILEVMNLSKSGLRSVCELHECVNLAVRRAQIKLAVWRSLVMLADKLRSRQCRGQEWDFTTFRQLAAKHKSGFVENLGPKMEANQAVEQLDRELNDISCTLRNSQTTTQKTLELLTQRIEAIDKRIRVVERKQDMNGVYSVSALKSTGAS